MKESIFKTYEGKTFRFDCHPGVPCFNECCARLRLILTPYDILRMKNRVGLNSETFLDQYTDAVMEDSRFPMLKLKMREEGRQTCPFLAEQGCTIYEDRPSACRLYPIGRAATMIGGEGRARESFFVVHETHCLGFQEPREWTMEEWLKSEGLSEYNVMNNHWLEIVTCGKGFGPEENVPKKMQVFYLASYNLDRFREFLFKGRFFDLFEVSEDLKKAIAEDDERLLLFSFDWLKHALFGEASIEVKRKGPFPG